ncbi:AbiU2 domain-containing protein [Bradyrhizobium sp. 1200_D9_N1_1]|uniref:AbiU2 domain-containing protein n=1 Tax=Bradyrhizobium sp. 1200_D9_N1_1 TaxID=3239013 RepID=UPI003F8CEF1B
METLSEMVTEIHLASLDLAASYGVFHGMNDALGQGRVESGGPSQAVGVIQGDLIRMVAFRVCALCEESKRRDDANISLVLKALDDPSFCEALIAKDRLWRAKVLARASMVPDAASNMRSLRERWDTLKSNSESLDRIRHLRNKKLGHVTVGFQKENRALLHELWTLVKATLRVAEGIQLVFAQTDCRYQEAIDSYHRNGRALIDGLRK